MDGIWQVARLMAAIELSPGDPADITALLRNPVERARLLLADPDDVDPTSAAGNCEHASNTDFGDFVASQLDHGRVESWAKAIDRGIVAGRFEPLIYGENGYPKRLWVIPDAPPVLFRRLIEGTESGQPADWDRVAADDIDHIAVAIVGARDADADVRDAAYDLAASLGRERARIISGLAAGVDTAAHQGALSVGAVTTAVMGTGTERVFPAENAELADEISRLGVVLSQFGPTAPRTATTFLRRNCVIAGMSDASVVMAAGERSGSRHELDQALRYRKPVFLWTPSLGDVPWARKLVRSRQATFVRSAEEVLHGLR